MLTNWSYAKKMSQDSILRFCLLYVAVNNLPVILGYFPGFHKSNYAKWMKCHCLFDSGMPTLTLLATSLVYRDTLPSRFSVSPSIGDNHAHFCEKPYPFFVCLI